MSFVLESLDGKVEIGAGITPGTGRRSRVHVYRASLLVVAHDDLHQV